MKKILIILFTTLLLIFNIPANAADYSWAADSIAYCASNGILQGMENGDLNLEGTLTNAQMAKMMSKAFNLKNNNVFYQPFSNHWAFNYINNFQDCIIKKTQFNPNDAVTRESFAASLVIASKAGTNPDNANILMQNFKDFVDVDPEYYINLCIAVEHGFLCGSYNKINPKDYVRRVEAAVFITRALGIQSTINVPSSEIPQQTVENKITPLLGESQITYETAQRWAKDKGAHQRFIDVAPIYWKYGSLTGIRPEILYAQAAKETGFGKYGGKVLPEMNNWAGIKTKTATGDATEDHETFATPDDGVRGHFNHMCAYVGVDPIGTPHDRYYNVKSLSWAGTIKSCEELGGKWCPTISYGTSIVNDYLNPMLTYK